MTITIDPTFLAWLPLIGYLFACFCAVMIGRGLEARKELQKMKKGA